MTTLVVRSLRPDDAAAAAALHVSAFRGFFLAQLGVRFMRSFYRGYARVPGGVGVVALSGDRLIGVVVGTTRPEGFFRALLKRELLGFVVASAAAFLRDPRVAPRLIRAVAYRGEVPGDVDGALLSSICVDPTTGQSGVGTALVEAWELQVRGTGATAAYLTTDAVGNERVNAFYRSRGWQLAGRFTTHEGRDMHCYIRDLSEGAS